MPNLVPLTVNLPADVLEVIEQEAREQYSNRGAIVRKILADEINRRVAERSAKIQEVAA